MKLTVGIVGSRDYPDEERVRAYVRSLPPGTTVVSGGRRSRYWPAFIGRGVDVWAADEAEKCGLTVVEKEPNPNAHGIPGCFHVRNGEIVTEVADAIANDGIGWITAFSKRPITAGTWSTINQAERRDVKVKIDPMPRPQRRAA